MTTRIKPSNAQKLLSGSVRSSRASRALPRNPFPPPELKTSQIQVPHHEAAGTVQAWSSIQAPSTASLSALAARLDFNTSPPSSSSSQSSSSSSDSSTATTLRLLEQALTHPSALPVHAHFYPDTPFPPTNKNLATVGNSLLGLFASEWVHGSFPHLPNRVLKAAISAYVGPRTLSDVAKEWGILPLMRWSQHSTTADQFPTLQLAALASFPRSLVAILAEHASFERARDFAHAHFLSRLVDLEPLFKFENPKRALVETAEKFGRPRPISRLLKETGRYTSTPMFVVGIYSGEEKLGEGFGHSLKMSEFRAAEDSLKRLYLTRNPHPTLPTSAFGSTFSLTSLSGSEPLDVEGGALASNDVDGESDYRPASIGESEVLYASAGRTGSVPKQSTP